MSETETFEALARAKYVSLTTYRRNGEAVSTPVWVAPDRDGRRALYLFTGRSTGKIKRLRRNPSVSLAPCTARGRVTGEGVEGRARILPAAEGAAADRALNRKYPVAKRLLLLPRLLRRSGGGRAYVEILLTDVAAAIESA